MNSLIFFDKVHLLTPVLPFSFLISNTRLAKTHAEYLQEDRRVGFYILVYLGRHFRIEHDDIKTFSGKFLNANFFMR